MECPLSDQEHLRLSGHANTIVTFSVFPRPGRVYAYREGRLHSLHSKAFDGAIYRYNPSRDSLTTCEPANPFPELGPPGKMPRGFRLALWNFLLSAAQELSIRSQHGGTILVVHDVARFTRAYPGTKADRAHLERWGDVSCWEGDFLCGQLEKDGAVVIDGRKGTMLAYGMKLSPRRHAEKAALARCGHILKKHGTKHLSAAATATEFPDAYAVVVSERGSITVFRQGRVGLRIE